MGIESKFSKFKDLSGDKLGFAYPALYRSREFGRIVLADYNSFEVTFTILADPHLDEFSRDYVGEQCTYDLNSFERDYQRVGGKVKLKFD